MGAASANTFDLPKAIVPAEIVVNPVAVFVPDKVSVPDPVLVKPTDVADPFSMTPENVVVELSPPAVSVGVPEAVLVIKPLPAIEPTVSDLLQIHLAPPLMRLVLKYLHL
jgi:hypothetical protein